MKTLLDAIPAPMAVETGPHAVMVVAVHIGVGNKDVLLIQSDLKNVKILIKYNILFHLYVHASYVSLWYILSGADLVDFR